MSDINNEVEGPPNEAPVELVDATVLCVHKLCTNYGVTISLSIPIGGSVFCGPCGNLLNPIRTDGEEGVVDVLV